jgi:hypothetical protein
VLEYSEAGLGRILGCRRACPDAIAQYIDRRFEVQQRSRESAGFGYLQRGLPLTAMQECGIQYDTVAAAQHRCRMFS